MLRTLAANNPILYAVVFALTVALLWPVFDTQYVNTDESLYLACAQRLADGGALYADAWENKPPVLVWLYTLFYLVFGSYSLFAIRIFGLVYLFGSGLLFNQLLYNFRIVREFTLLPALLYILVFSVPWYAWEVNGELLMSLPLLLMVVLLALYINEERRDYRSLLWIGVLGGLLVCIKYQAVFLVLGLGLTFVTTARVRLKELLTSFIGFLLPITACLLWIHFTGSMQAFWDIGILYNLDYLQRGLYPGEVVSWYSAWEYVKYWGGFGLLALLGFLSFRVRFINTSIRQRKLESLFATWLLMGFVTILAGGARLYLHYFLIVLAPLLFYALFFLESRMSLRWQNRVLWAASLVPLLSWGSYFVLRSPTLYNHIQPYTKPGGWTQNLYIKLNGSAEEKAIGQLLSQKGIQAGVWVADFQPELYVRLGVSPALPYTNFSILWTKLNWLPQHPLPNYPLASQPVTLQMLYDQLEKEPPKAVIDPLGFFGYLKHRMPLLLADYRPYTAGKWQVYLWEPELRK